MGRVVIAVYQPLPGKREQLKTLMKTHLTILREQQLVTDRESIIMESQDGTIVEVFEWRSAEAMTDAHTNPAVLAMWEEYGQVCQYIPISQVPEATSLFSEFTPLN